MAKNVGNYKPSIGWKKLGAAAAITMLAATAAAAACTHQWSCTVVIGPDGKPTPQCGWVMVCK